MSHPSLQNQQTLNPWAQQAKKHWKEFRPKMYRELQRSGQLNQALRQAAENTVEDLINCIHRGMKYDQAWELVRERYLFLPSEEDQPHLAEQNDPLNAELRTAP